MADAPTDRHDGHLNVRRTSLAISGFLVVAACLVLLWPLLTVISWAAILSYVTWPVYRVVRRPFRRWHNCAAFVMTLLLGCAVIAPLLWVVVLVSRELLSAYGALGGWLASSSGALPDSLRNIPWLGDQVQELVNTLTGDSDAFSQQLAALARSGALEIGRFGGSLGRGFAGGVLVMFTAFFFYRDGESIVAEIRAVARRMVGTRIDPYFVSAIGMIRAVLAGFLVTAVAQGLMAGLGYTLVGLPRAALLGTATGILSVIPVLGTALVWVPLGVYLIATEQLWKGVIVFAWGFLLVHPTDNILRPLLISNATKVPFLVVMFGALGGLAAWGLVGAVLGPVILATGLSIWRHWARAEAAAGASD